MASTIVNRIVTRGMGPSRGQTGDAGLITQGYGGLRLLLELGRRIIHAGQSGLKRRLRELQTIIVGARLVRVNDEKPKVDVKGFTEVNVTSGSRVSRIQLVSTKVRKAWEDINIHIKRLK